jgi:L-alanine-DL-glutamate epimerase-like enolase superfamily enzyme
MLTRRTLLAAGGLGLLAGCASPATRKSAPLLSFADAPIARHDFTRVAGAPLILDRIELLWINKNEHMIVGYIAGGLTVYLPSNKRFGDDLPLFAGRVLPHFLGQDLRFIEQHIDSCARANYKIVGLPFWNHIGHLEMLALEAIGQASKRPVFDLVGGQKHRSVAVYLSNRDRHTTPEQEIDAFLLPRIEATGARAAKLGIGGRMSRNADAWPGRSEALVARARQILGDDCAIAVDANGSYDAESAIAVGRMLEGYGVWFFEEPCPFEEFEMTRQVTQALEIAVAGGEQDSSAAKWRWMIDHRMVDVVQPDLFYAGGFLRSLRYATAAADAGLDCIPHAPRAHAGAATMLQFIACLDRPGAFHEFSAKAALAEPAYDYAPRLSIRDGQIAIPTGPGFGIDYDVDAIRRIGRPVALTIGTIDDGD